MLEIKTKEKERKNERKNGRAREGGRKLEFLAVCEKREMDG